MCCWELNVNEHYVRLTHCTIFSSLNPLHFFENETKDLKCSIADTEVVMCATNTGLLSGTTYGTLSTEAEVRYKKCLGVATKYFLKKD